MWFDMPDHHRERIPPSIPVSLPEGISLLGRRLWHIGDGAASMDWRRRGGAAPRYPVMNSG